MTLDEFRTLQARVSIGVAVGCGLIALAGVSYAVWTCFH